MLPVSIDPTTGAASQGGGFAVNDLLASYMSTVATAVGLATTEVQNLVINGTPVAAVLR